MADGACRPTQHHDVSKIVVAISREDLIIRLHKHVLSRGAPKLPNGAWALMLEAANQLTAITVAEQEQVRRLVAIEDKLIELNRQLALSV